jgi:hypothetical protein
MRRQNAERETTIVLTHNEFQRRWHCRKNSADAASIARPRSLAETIGRNAGGSPCGKSVSVSGGDAGAGRAESPDIRTHTCLAKPSSPTTQHIGRNHIDDNADTSASTRARWRSIRLSLPLPRRVNPSRAARLQHAAGSLPRAWAPVSHKYPTQKIPGKIS